jgi:hypothetical protein
LVETVWVDLTQAEKLDLPLITGQILQELVQRLNAGMDDMFPVPFFYTRNKQRIREEF